MQIILETPYKEKWKQGYLVTNKENRKHVVLFNTNKNRTTTSYARYLMSVKLGYEVPKEFEVDHIDNNKTNDSLDNLQLLSPQANRSKQASSVIKEIKHGTLTAYRHCKCELCVQAKRNWYLSYKRLKTQ